MQIKHNASAGTMESSDAMVTVESGGNGIELELISPVLHQFGHQMRKVVLESLERLHVDNARITVFDKGALDCTLKARVEAAVYRACDASESDIPWGGSVR